MSSIVDNSTVVTRPYLDIQSVFSDKTRNFALTMNLDKVKKVGKFEGVRKQKMLPPQLASFFNRGLWVSHAKPYLGIRSQKGPMPISNL